MHRKARISNPTFKTSPHICSKSGGRSPPLFYYASPCPSEAAGALSSRSMALRYGSIDKAVHALAVGFCVGSEQMARSTSRARNRVNKFVKTLFRVLLFSNAVENVITQDCI